MARRRSRTSFDPRMLPVVAGLFVLFLAYRLPSFGDLLAAAFALLAVCFWLLGAWRRMQHLHRWGAVSNMYALSPEAFEAHVADTFAALGYATTVTKRVGDQGIDVLAERGRERIGIQCKRTNDAVSNGAVQEAYAGKAHYGCTSANVVALGGFTASARTLAASTGVSLIDGAAYADLFLRATTSKTSRSIWTVIPSRSTVMRTAVCGLIAFVSFAAAQMHGTTQSVTAAQATSVNYTSTSGSLSPGDTVKGFYSAVNSHDLPAAYSLLSPDFKNSTPYASFAAGYATTTNVYATTTNDDGPTVDVHLVAKDRNADGSIRTTEYDGYWTVTKDASGGWLLEDGRFHKS